METTNGKFQEWRISDAEFKGYVKARLEELTADHERIDELEKDVAGLKVQSGIIGTIGGIVGGFAAGIFGRG